MEIENTRLRQGLSRALDEADEELYESNRKWQQKYDGVCQDLGEARIEIARLQDERHVHCQACGTTDDLVIVSVPARRKFPMCREHAGKTTFGVQTASCLREIEEMPEGWVFR